MSPSHFLTLDAPSSVEDVRGFLPILGASLTGAGPPILPLPKEPSRVRERLTILARSEEELESQGIALLVPTSGSSGEPKLALLSQRAIRASVDATHDALGGPGRWLLTLPTSHVAGLQVLTRSLLAGFPPVVVDRSNGFQPRPFIDGIAELLEGSGPEPRYASLVPTQLHRLLEAGGAAVHGLVALDAVLLGGAAAPPHLVQRAHEHGITLVQSYGMTETCGGCVYDGVPLAGMRISFGLDRRIQLEGPMVFSGYRGDPELTRQTLKAGRLLTNDLGKLDEHGRLVVSGRMDDVVISGGINVSCQNVEGVLLRHPAVQDIVVVGVPDEEWGQRLVAIAVSDRSLSVDSLRSFGQRELDPAELPHQLVVLDEIPMVGSDKPDRAALQQLAATLGTREPSGPRSDRNSSDAPDLPSASQS